MRLFKKKTRFLGTAIMTYVTLVINCYNTYCQRTRSNKIEKKEREREKLSETNYKNEKIVKNITRQHETN